MIERWNDWTNRPVFKFVFTLVMLSFVLGGIGTNLVGRSNYAVKVNGVEISQEQFQQVKNRQQTDLVNRQGEKAWDLLDNPEFAAQFNQSVLDGLIDNELFRQYANELKLGVGADQIKKTIVSNPAFQQDGKFNNDLYLAGLRNAQVTADGYAAMIAQGILFDQIQEGVLESHFTVPAQQTQMAKWLLQKRQARIATFSIADEAQKQTASEQELQAYYDAHKATLMNPEKVTVEYVLLTPEAVKDKAALTDAQIEDYYAKNRDAFKTRGESRLAHIQVADETQANEIAQALQNGADFAQLAKEKSQDQLSAGNGGDLGWAAKGTYPAAFENAADVLTVGKVSPAIKVDGNYHLIKLLDRKSETVLPLEKVKAQIVATLQSQLKDSAYSSVASQMANDAVENSGSLEVVAKNAGLTVQKTEAFSRENVPAVLANDKVVKALFEGDLRQSGQNSEAFDVSRDNTPATLIVRVSDYQPSSVKTFEQAAKEVEAAVKRQKAEHALLAKAESDVKALNEGQSVNVNFAPAKTFVYAQAKIEDAVLAKTLFSMPKPADKATFAQSRNKEGDITIVALDSVTDGTLAEFQPLIAQFNREEGSVLRDDFMKDLRERASIDISEEFLESLSANTANH